MYIISANELIAETVQKQHAYMNYGNMMGNIGYISKRIGHSVTLTGGPGIASDPPGPPGGPFA